MSSSFQKDYERKGYSSKVERPPQKLKEKKIKI